MNRFFKLSVLILFFSINALAKSVTVYITVKNFKGSISIYNPEFRYDLTKKKIAALQLDAHGLASYTMGIDKPTYLVLYSLSNSSFKWCLFLSPGDELFLTADFAKKNDQVTVTGKGSNNNQPEIFALTNMDTQPFKGDATPDRVVVAINRQFLINKNILTNYIKVNKPSIAFIKNAMMNLKYFVPKTYYEFSHNSLFKPKEQQRKWQKIQDSVFSTVKLSNDDALIAYNYTQLIDNFIFRETEELAIEYNYDPALFFKKVFRSNPAEGKRIFNHWDIGIVTQKIIDKYFTGKAAEYAYVPIVKFKFSEADYQSVVSIYNHFKNEFPASAYVKGFSATVAEIVNKQQKVLSSKTIFVKNNGTKLNTFKDILALTKGKVALIDMWGTWCSPCREEIEKNATKLSTYFKGKNVDLIYIANYDSGREKEWKKQIAYFQIGGTHILANPQLTKDIMGKAKASGYPTYIIIKKDGSYRKTTTQLPVNLQAMIKEIEAVGL